MKIGFVGMGTMGEALMRSVLEIGDPDIFLVSSDISEERRNLFSNLDNVEVTKSNLKVASECDIVFIAVKPQHITGVLDEIKDVGKLVISIVAGIRIEELEGRLKKARVIRLMPNTPCIVGEMAGVYSLGKFSTFHDGELLQKILAKAGKIFQLDEEHLDAVTALSGSGPAFVSYIIRAMAKGGTNQGLPEEIAEQLAIQTVLGTGKLLRDRKLSPEKLIEMVSSPGGTTVAGMQVLGKSDVKDVLGNTIAAAAKRGKELGSQQSSKQEKPQEKRT